MPKIKIKTEKIKKEKVDKPKAASIFDFIEWLTTKKKKWEELTFLEQKAVNPFIINRFLAMDLYLCEAVNELQEYTTGMDKDKFWRVYYELLPKQRPMINYIKNQTDELNQEELSAVKKYFNESEQNSIDYLLFLKSTDTGQVELNKIVKNYI